MRSGGHAWQPTANGLPAPLLTRGALPGHTVYGGGGGAGGGGPSTGTVIGGRPGISMTVEPATGGRPGIAPSGGGGGGGGGMPLLTWMVMIEPGTVCPDGDVPTTVPADEALLTEEA